MSRELTRRKFMAAAGSAVGAALLPDAAWASTRSVLPSNPVILFQGDSITDFGRNRKAEGPNDSGALGTGYPLLLSSALLRAHPDDQISFYNRGISGNKVPDLQARWDADTLALEPDVLSILIGVNDYWHKLTNGYTGTVADYESGYTALLGRTRQALPDVKLVILEPFILPVGAVDASWIPEFDQRRAVAARVAQNAGAVFIPLQSMFTNLAALHGKPEYWLRDGVHPTPAGHAAIAERWRAEIGI